MKPTLCILAAGIGSRFGGFKQMEPAGPNGELLLDYSIYDARKAGFGRIVFVISKKIGTDFKGYMDAHYGSRADFVYVYQELENIPEAFSVPAGRTKPWGTGHAVLSCREAIAGVPFAVINADDYYGARTFSVLCEALGGMVSDSTRFVMVGFELEKTLSEHGAVARGVCSVENEYVTSIVEREKIGKTGNAVYYETPSGEKVALDPHTTVSMNCWGFAPATVYPMLEKDFEAFLRAHGNELKAEFYLPSAINNGLARKAIAVRMLYTREQWFGMTYPQDIASVKGYLAKKVGEGAYPARLF
ncbi:MAG: nucleotidyltransferase [Chitinispirillaceae bacterium]|jgi:UTP-glucose-1-phosphate uridylyltransferase